MNKKTVQHIALLANLELSSKEIKKFQKQLTEILDYVGQLSKVETKNIKPTSQVTGLENVFRKDKPGPSLSSKDVLASAKKTDKGMFKIKAIFEQWS